MMQQAHCLSKSDLLHLQRNELHLREIELDSLNTTNIISAYLLERDSISHRLSDLQTKLKGASDNLIIAVRDLLPTAMILVDNRDTYRFQISSATTMLSKLEQTITDTRASHTLRAKALSASFHSHHQPSLPSPQCHSDPFTENRDYMARSNAKVVTYYEHFDESNFSLCREGSYDASVARMCIFSILRNSMKDHRHLISDVMIGDNFSIWQIYSNSSCVSYAQNQMAALDFSQVLMLPDETFSTFLRR
jgi:hypothetical protein